MRPSPHSPLFAIAASSVTVSSAASSTVWESSPVTVSTTIPLSVWLLSDTSPLSPPLTAFSSGVAILSDTSAALFPPSVVTTVSMDVSPSFPVTSSAAESASTAGSVSAACPVPAPCSLPASAPLSVISSTSDPSAEVSSTAEAASAATLSDTVSAAKTISAAGPVISMPDNSIARNGFPINFLICFLL